MKGEIISGIYFLSYRGTGLFWAQNTAKIAEFLQGARRLMVYGDSAPQLPYRWTLRY